MAEPALSPKRAQHIGSSEIGSLFSIELEEGGHKVYESRYQLWHRKRGDLVRESIDDVGAASRTFWGRLQERTIAQGAASVLRWDGVTQHLWRQSHSDDLTLPVHRPKIQNVRRYIAHRTVAGMGASLDFEVVSHPLGAGVLEAKSVDGHIYRDWPELEGADSQDFCKQVGVPWLPVRREPPLRHQLQLQHQLACTGRSWGLLAILVGGNRFYCIPYPRVEPTIARIEAEVEAFWASIAADNEPPIDWSADFRTVAQLYGHADEARVCNLRGDDEALGYARRYLAAREKRKAAEVEREQMKAQLLLKIGDARRAFLDDQIVISAGRRSGGGRTFTVNQRS